MVQPVKYCSYSNKSLGLEVGDSGGIIFSLQVMKVLDFSCKTAKNVAQQLKCFIGKINYSVYVSFHPHHSEGSPFVSEQNSGFVEEWRECKSYIRRWLCDALRLAVVVWQRRRRRKRRSIFVTYNHSQHNLCEICFSCFCSEVFAVITGFKIHAVAFIILYM